VVQDVLAVAATDASMRWSVSSLGARKHAIDDIRIGTAKDAKSAKASPLLRVLRGSIVSTDPVTTGGTGDTGC
jgi:hypothetical protein